ncbi:MAG: NAD(P)H-hydrate dehydratase [Rhodospirillaceae bacterium]
MTDAAPTDQSEIQLLSVSEMYAAEGAAIASGIAGERLMEAAGAAIAAEICRRWASRPVAILCGPGNNGGDGFVVARLLRDAGWPVTVSLLGDRAALAGDAAIHADRWTGEVRPLSPASLDGAELVVDAIFGAGLARPLDGMALDVVRRIDGQGAPCVAVDIPSGVHGDTGLVLGAAPQAVLTVTFVRRKPGHLLLPGRVRAGDVIVADIGIPESVIREIGPATWANAPGLWADSFPWPGLAGHKYTRGHALVSGGGVMTGAGRLAARAARRIGAGLLTVASSPAAVGVYAADAPGVLTQPFTTAEEFDGILDDPRFNAVLVGPGNGVNRTTHDIALAAAGRGRQLVVDADALTVFADAPDELFAAVLDIDCVLTPHEGEFSRLFRMTGDKLSRTRKAAALSGAVVLLKGADTVIAHPDGRAAINENAPPALATAGAGDVLAGLILGLLAQGMDPFEAACAANWIHGDAAARFGPGLIAEDICDLVPSVLRYLKGKPEAP